MNLTLDIGATTTKIGFSKDSKKIKKFLIRKTPLNYKEFLKFVSDFSRNFNFKKIIVGIAGMVKNGKIIYSPNLGDFNNRNLSQDLKKIFKAKVIVKNDAELAGLGEAVFGAGKNFNIFGYITLSSGIGGAKVVNKKIEDNFFGFEPGHSLFLLDDFGFLEIEEIIGGKSIEKIFYKKPEEIKDKKFWSDINKIFAGFLVNVAIFWSVEAIIIGGSIIKSLDFDELKVNFNNLKTVPLKTKILKSRLKEKAGIYGGLLLLKNNL